MGKDKLISLLGAALFVSLCANLFMGGLMLGHSFSGGQGEVHAAWKKRDEALRKLLSPADRAVLKKEMQSHRAEFAALRRKITRAQDEVEKALNAKPFDQKTLDEAIARERDAKSEALEKMQSVRESVMQNVSPEGRDILQKMGPFDRSRAEMRRPPRFRGRAMPQPPADAPVHLPENQSPAP